MYFLASWHLTPFDDQHLIYLFHHCTITTTHNDDNDNEARDASASRASGKFIYFSFVFYFINIKIRITPPQHIQTAARPRTTAGTTRRRRRRGRRGKRGKTWGSRRRCICVLSPGMFFLFYFYTILIFFSSRLCKCQLQPQLYEERMATTTTTSTMNDTKKKAQETRLLGSFIFFTFLLLIFIIRLLTTSTSKATPSPWTATQTTMRRARDAYDTSWAPGPSLPLPPPANATTDEYASETAPAHCHIKKRPKRRVWRCLGHRYVFFFIFYILTNELWYI